MKLYITTQYYENYGSADNPYWKAKGGEDYFYQLTGFKFNEMANKKLQMIVDSLSDRIVWSDEYSRQYIIGWELVEDDYMTQFERNQLEYDGKITFFTQYLNDYGLTETV